MLDTGLYPGVLARGVLCTLNKVEGSVEVGHTRPIGLLVCWKNAMTVLSCSMQCWFHQPICTTEATTASGVVLASPALALYAR